MLADIKRTLRKPLHPIARGLDAAGVGANHVTMAGVTASALAAISLAWNQIPLALIWLLIGLLCDMLDGDLARLRPGKATGFGAFLDSTMDRISEALLFGGLLIAKQYHDGPAGWIWLSLWVLALSGSFMVSYARARAEGLGLDCAVGIAERPERMVILFLLILMGLSLSGWFLLLLAGLAWWTVYQRIRHTAGRIRERQSDHAAPQG
jgi:phosphatidylglycerophosphate synthase